MLAWQDGQFIEHHPHKYMTGDYRSRSGDAMSKIAVTGSNGTIGARLCADLAHDYQVVRINIEDAEVTADVRDFDAMRSALEGCETVIHLAGVVAVDADWESVYHTNIGGTYNVYEAARRTGAKRIIFASSNHCVGMHEVQNAPAIYEPGSGVVIGTDEPYRPDGLYGVWKAFGETLGRFYSDAYGVQVSCIRIGSITKPTIRATRACARPANG